MLLKTNRSFLLMVTGLLALTSGVLIRIFHPYELIYQWKLVFGEGGEIFTLWAKPPIDLYCKIYLFNITNAEEFLAGKEKMRVEQVGPYVYKEIFEHHEIEFNDNNTLSTRPRHPLVWQEELSEGRKEDDVLMMVNIALLSIAQVGAEKSYFVRLPINLLIRQTNSQPIVKMTAREFMFGFETPLTTLGNTFLPNWIHFDKVGLIDRMYDFNADYETFYTGSDDPSKAGLYATYMGSQNLPQWKGDHCSNINMASDGTKFQGLLEPNATVKFFRKSMCRPQTMVPIPEEYIVSDLAARKYVFEENALDNGYYNEKNKCYCRQGYCQPRGLIDVTDCYYGFPISLSYPHFMDADPELLEAIDGLTPNRTHHESYFMVNPKSGLPLQASVKLQINMHMRNVKSMSNVADFSGMTIPMLWFEITMPKLPDPLKNRFNLYLNILPYIDIVGFWGGLGIGAFCVIFAITRATMTLPFMSSDVSKKSKKYTKVNLRSGVYNPCEMKMMEANEKFIHSFVSEAMMDEIDSKDANNFYLQREPAISEHNDGNASDSSQRSTQSTRSIQSMRSTRSTEYNSSDNSSPLEISERRVLNPSSRRNSAFTTKDLNDCEIGCDNWEIGEASSLIEDIGNEHFPILMISEDGDKEHTNQASTA